MSMATKRKSDSPQESVEPKKDKSDQDQVGENPANQQGEAAPPENNADMEEEMPPLDIVAVVKRADTVEHRRRTIEQCMSILVHVCWCRDDGCTRVGCQNMKNVVRHTRMCPHKRKRSCPTCKNLITACIFHARLCVKNICEVPFCRHIRAKLRQVELERLRMRTAFVNSIQGA